MSLPAHAQNAPTSNDPQFKTPRAGCDFGRVRGLGISWSLIGLVLIVAAVLITGRLCVAQTATPAAASVNFGSQPLAVASAQTAVTFNIGTGGTLGNTIVLTQGVANQDFTLGSGSTCIGTVSTGTCTVDVIFTPKASSLRLGAVELTNSSGAVIATAMLYGLGAGPVTHFTPGIINLVAGVPSTYAYNGDGTATTTQLGTVQYIVADGAGNMYFSDQGNNRVRYYDAAAKTVTTIVGTGNTTPYNDAVAGTSANITPNGLAMDGAGNLYIVDSANHRVREYNPVTKILTTIVGSTSTVQSSTPYAFMAQSGVAPLSIVVDPYGVAVDVSGKVYFTEFNNNVARVYTPSTGSTGTVALIAGNGTLGYNGEGSPATAYELNNPAGIGVGNDGNVYITEFGGERLRKVTVPGGAISTVIGNGNGSTSSVIKLAGIKFNAIGDMYLANQGYNVESKYTVATGVLSTIAGNGFPTGYAGDGGPATSAKLWQSNDMALDNAGDLYISDQFSNLIREVTLATPMALSEGSIAVGTTTTQTETIENDGTTNLAFSSITPSQSGVNKYFSTGGTCSTSIPLTPGSSCTIVVTFAPLVTGAQTGTVTVVDNSSVPAHTFTVSGTATAATGNTSQTINFTQPATPAAGGTSATLSATASSGLPITFSVVSGPAIMVSSNVVSYTGAGTVVLQAANYGNGTYGSATAQRTVTTTAVAATVGSTTSTLVATMTIATAGTVGSIGGYTQGVLNEDYKVVSGGTCTIGTAYTAAQTCTVYYTFSPQHPWVRLGGIEIGDTSGNIMSVNFINYTANGPQTVIGNGTLAPVYVGGGGVGLLANDNGIYSAAPSSVLSMDAVGNVYKADSYGNALLLYPVTGGPGQTICNGPRVAFASLANYTDGSLWAGMLATSGSSVSSYVVKFPVTSGGVVPATCSFSVSNIGFSYPIYASGLAFGPLALYSNTFGYIHNGYSRPTQIWSNNAVLNTSPSSFGNGFGGEGAAVNPEGDLFFVERQVNIRETPASELAANNASSSYAAATSIYYGVTNPSITGLATDGWGDLFFSMGGSAYKFDYRNPPALTFATTAVGTTSAAQTLTVTNNGNAALNIYSIAVSTNFVVTGGTCSTSTPVPASSASSCTITVAMKPQSGGSLTGTLTVNDNSLQGSHVVNLSGTGGPVVTGLSPNSGQTSGGTSVTIGGSGFTGAVAVNFGTTAAASFSVVSDTSITATSPAGSIGTVDVTVTTGGLPSATSTADQFTYSPASTYAAPSEPVGTASASQTAYVTFSATGTLGTINVLTQGAANKDYKPVSGGTCATGTSYTAGQSCSVLYTFTPSRPGVRRGAVSLTDNTGAVVLGTSYLNGTGTGPLATFPGSTALSAVGSGFKQPYGVAVDGSGNVFVADIQTNAVSEIVATNGVVNSNSAVIALSYDFSTPTSLAVDGSGNVFVTVTGQNAVKEIVAVNGAVSASSTVKTINSSFLSPYGVAVDGSGNVFVGDAGHDAVKEIVAVNGTVSSSSVITTVGSGFSGPEGVAIDGSGNVFVDDTNSGTVKEIVAVNGVVSSSSTVNTVGSGFTGSRNLALDGSGDVFVADSGNNAVKEIVAVNGVVSSSSVVNTVGSGYSYPTSVGVDGTGHLFVTDMNNNAVKKIDLTVAPALTFASTAVGAVSSPQSVTLQNAGNAALTLSSLATGTSNFAVNGTGTCSTSTSLAASAVCTVAASFTPQATGPLTDSLTLTDNSLNVTSSSQAVSLSGTGTAAAPAVTGISPASGPSAGGTSVTITGTNFTAVTGVSFGTAPAASYTINSATQITAVTPAGIGTVDTYVTTSAGTSQATSADQFSYVASQPLAKLTVTGYPASAPSGVAANVTVTAYDASNNVITGFTGTVTLTSSDATATLPAAYAFTSPDAGVHVFAVTLNTAGIQSLTATSGSITGSETGIVSTGYVAAISQSNSTLSKFTENGTPFSSSGYTGGGGATNSAAVDAAGDLFSVSNGNNVLVEFNSAGTALSGSGYAGGGLNAPVATAVDGAGQVWIVNQGGNSISVFTNSGTAVTPSTGYASGGYNAPAALSIDVSGNVWVVNSGNNTLTEVLGAAAPAAPPSTALTNGTTGVRP